MGELALNATAASILGFLDKGPMSGSDLAARLEDVIGHFWNVTRSQIYRELKVLADAALVETLVAGKRDRQPYRLTPAGRKAFRAWISAEAGPPIMRIPLVLQTFFADAVEPAQLAESRARLRAHHVERLAVYRGFEQVVPQPSPPHDALRLGIAFQEMMIAWIDSLGAPAPIEKRRSFRKKSSDR